MNHWELLFYVFLIALALLPLAVGARRVRKRAAIVAAGVVLLLAVSGLAWSPVEDLELQRGIPQQVQENGFVSSKSCRSCHPGNYASWHRTYHRTMTQAASPESVLAPFDNLKMESRGRSYHFERRGDEFWVTMADPDWETAKMMEGRDLNLIADPPIVARRVLMTTGSHHVQGYWIPSSHGNELCQIPWYYLIKEKRWVPREDAFLEPPDGRRHFKVWNGDCIKCHSVAGRPGYNFQTNNMYSDVAELGISCEACHGPAEEHVRFHRNPMNRYRRHLKQPPTGGGKSADPTIVNPATTSHETSTQICGQCHRFAVLGDKDHFMRNGLGFEVGDALEKSRRLIDYRDPANKMLEAGGIYAFWKDGACRSGGAEYNGTIESACYLKGELSCLSCHSMHNADPNDQLAARMDTNHACLQCHKQYRDKIEEHTHHPANSSGSLCYNCHMPYTSYALLTAIRSHRIESPDITSSIRTGRPNACNLCHLDQTLDWSAKQLTAWFGTPTVETSDDEKQVAASLLWLLSGNAIQRAITAWHVGWSPAQQASGTDWLAPHAAQLLDDPYSTVRFIAHRSLQTLPNFQKFKFDFIGPPDGRSKSVSGAVDLWRQSRQAAEVSNGPRMLLDSKGQLLENVQRRLLKQRNDRPAIQVPE